MQGREWRSTCNGPVDRVDHLFVVTGSVRLGYGIQVAVVHTKAMTTIFLPNHDNGARPGAARWLDHMCFLHTLQLSCNFFSNSERHPSRCTSARIGSSCLDIELDEICLPTLMFLQCKGCVMLSQEVDAPVAVLSSVYQLVQLTRLASSFSNCQVWSADVTHLPVRWSAVMVNLVQALSRVLAAGVLLVQAPPVPLARQLQVNFLRRQSRSIQCGWIGL